MAWADGQRHSVEGMGQGRDVTLGPQCLAARAEKHPEALSLQMALDTGEGMSLGGRDTWKAARGGPTELAVPWVSP